MSRLIEKETAHRILFLVGFIFIGAGFVLDVGQPGDYWYAQFRETYQDFDIYYLPSPGGLFGITYGGEEPTLGGSGYLAFIDTLDGARSLIDNWVMDPTFIETFLRWDLYREPALGQRYYGVDILTNEESSKWMDLQPLKDYLYGIYYGALEGFWTITTADTVYSSELAPLPEGMLFPVNSATFTFTITEGVVDEGSVFIDTGKIPGEMASPLSEVDSSTWSATVTGITEGDHLLTLWVMNVEVQSSLDASFTVTSPPLSTLDTLGYVGVGVIVLGAVGELRFLNLKKKGKI